MLKVFGCRACYHVDDVKLKPSSKNVVFVGCESIVKCFKIWPHSEWRVIFSRDVNFYQDSAMLEKSKETLEGMFRESMRVQEQVEFSLKEMFDGPK